MPNMEYSHKELRRKGVTLQLLWEEYKQANPDGYQRTQFCQLYRDWVKTIDVSMRQTHIAGEKGFVDYARQTLLVVDLSTGDTRDAFLFIAVLGASNYTYAGPSWDQTWESWIGSHVKAFEFFGGVPKVIVPEYVPRNIFGVMFPTALCAGGPRTPTDDEGKRPMVSGMGHITITTTQANSGAPRLTAIRV